MLKEYFLVPVFVVVYISQRGYASNNQSSTFEKSLIGGTCMDLSDCVGDWPRVDCSPQKICVCGTGYIQKSDLTDCLRILGEIGEPCEESQQCKAGNLGELSDCIPDRNLNKQCACKDTAVSETPRSECLLKATKINDTCKIQAQCLPNLILSSCISGKCKCNDNAVDSSDGSVCLPRLYIGDEGCIEPGQCTHLYPTPVNCHPKDSSNPALGSECRCNNGYINPDRVNCYRLATVIGEPCDKHEVQCHELENARCLTGICDCKRDAEVVSEDKKRCLPKRDLHDSCEETGQCVTGSNCWKRKCECIENKFIESNSKPGTCIEIMNAEEEQCTEDIQCTSGLLGEQSHCYTIPETRKSVCRCTSDAQTIPGASVKKCYARITQVGLEDCEADEQCQFALGSLSECSKASHKCKCISGSVPSSTSDRCLPGPVKVGERCEDNNQCPGENIRGECFNNKCRCNNGFVASIAKDECLQILDKLNFPCVEPQQCQNGLPGEWSDCVPDESGTPPVLVCQCSQQGVAEPNEHYCHKKAVVVGDACDHAIQCEAGLGLSSCVDRRCICLGHAVPNDDKTRCVEKRFLGDKCFYQYECTHIPYNAICQYTFPGAPEYGGVCKCNVGFVQIPGNNMVCHELASSIEDSCEHNVQCSSIGHTSCLDNLCKCQADEYVASQDKRRCLELVPALEGTCEEDQQCQVQNSGCRTGKCVCLPGFVESRINPGRCIEIINEISQPCGETVQCTAGLGEGSECNSERKCVCLTGYGYYDHYCYLKSSLHERCLFDQECIVGINDQAFCNVTSNRCSCKDTAIEHLNSCLRKATEIGDSCSLHSQCTTNLGNLSKCDENGKCSCVSGSVPDADNKRCITGNILIGDPCEFNSQCFGYPDTAECLTETTGRCHCKDGFTPSLDRMKCLKIQNQLGGECQENNQCTDGIPGNWSHCSGGVCQCTPGAVDEGHRCYRKATLVGDICELNIQCTTNLDLSHCINSRCKCYDYAIENSEKSRCISKKYLNEECDEASQCSHMQSASCYPVDPSNPGSQKYCKCYSGFVQSEKILNTCVQVQDNINLPCDENIQCTAGLGDKSECRNNLCRCISGHDYYDSHCYQPVPLDGYCQLNEECYVGSNNFTECKAGRCSCLNDFVPYRKLCYKKVFIGDSCSSDTECMASIRDAIYCDQVCKCVSGKPDMFGLTCSASSITFSIVFSLTFSLFASVIRYL